MKDSVIIALAAKTASDRVAKVKTELDKSADTKFSQWFTSANKLVQVAESKADSATQKANEASSLYSRILDNLSGVRDKIQTVAKVARDADARARRIEQKWADNPPRDGQDGATWYLTEGKPGASLGDRGDFAFDSESIRVWHKLDKWEEVADLAPKGGGGMTMMAPALRPTPYRNVVYTDVDRTAQYGDLVIVTATSTQTLPAAQNHVGELITIKRLNATALVTVVPQPGENIDGDATGRIFNIDTWSEDYISDGNDWVVV